MRHIDHSRTADYVLADFNIRIIFKDARANGVGLVPSFEPFLTGSAKGGLLFQMTVDDALPPAKGRERERIDKFDTGNGETVVDRLPGGGYQFIIKDIGGGECCLLQTNKDFTDCRCALNGNHGMRRFGLNNALMLAFAFSGCFKQALLMHASVIRKDGRGYAFIAKSGTGKSTHTSLWMKHIPGCELMNDDNPIVRVVNGVPFIYGSPWSGKTPCYRAVKARLGAVTRIDRDKENSVERLCPAEAFASLLPSCSSMRWDKDLFDAYCDNVTRLVETVGIYTLHCRPDEEAAVMCHNAISR